MLLLLVSVVFFLTLGVGMVAGGFRRGSSAALDRVRDPSRPAGPALATRSGFSWIHIPRSVGELVQAGRGREQLKQDLVRAGIRAPNAEAIFFGMRVIAALAGLALVAGVMV